MNEIVELLVNFINTKIEQAVQDFKREISAIPVREQSVSAEEMERLLNVLGQGRSGDGEFLQAVERLGRLDEEWHPLTDQVGLVSSFLDICNEFSDYTGFFVYRGGKATCYDATPHDHFPQRGVRVDAPEFQDVVPIQEANLPAAVTDPFSGIEDTYVIPLKLKFKPAGFVISVLSDAHMLSVVRVAVSMLSKELTLLPLKARSIGTQQVQKPVAPDSRVDKPEAIPVSGESTGSMPSPSFSSVAAESPMERAVRYAKLLASEIKLYNEKAVQQGLKSGGLRELLQADIDRSYNAFRERFPNSDEVPDRIFEEALIRYLADGNPDLL